MEQQLRELLARFSEIHGVQGVLQVPLDVDFQVAPHRRPTPLQNQYGVYLFFLNDQWLRIGQTGYSQRFTSQHYGIKRAASNFSKDIWTSKDEFGYNGAEGDISHWILDRCGRANIRIPKVHGEAMARLLEAFLHLHLLPRFEGRRRQ